MCSDQGELLCCSFNGEQVYELNEGDCNRLENMESKEAIDNTYSENPFANKLLRDGLLLIQKGDKTFDLRGQEVK